MTNQSIAETLGRDNLCICPNFLSPSEVEYTRNDLEAIRLDGRFHTAGTGKGTEYTQSADLRRDSIYWLEESEATLAQALLWRKIGELQQALNRELYLGLQEFEGHYTSYPEGGFYKKHLDCFAKDQTRVVSLALYLTRNWHPDNGGELRIYEKNSYQDISPIAGTLVCFLSAESEHEVRSNHAERLSITGWFKRQPVSR